VTARVQGVVLVVAAVAIGVAAAWFGRREEAESRCDRVREPFEQRAVKAVVVEKDAVRVIGPEREQRVPRAPRRIVSTLPGLTEIVAALGGTSRLVAVSPWCDFPPEVADLPKIGVQPLDLEALLAADADLVLTDTRLLRRELENLRARLPAVLELETSRSLLDLGDAIDAVAQVLDTPDARAAAARWRRGLDSLLRTLEQKRVDPVARVLVVGQWDPLYALGPGSLLDDALRLLGCINIACDLADDASAPFSEELVLARRPAWILSTAGPAPAGLLGRWEGVPAVTRGRVANADADDLVRAGPRVLEGFRRLALTLAGEIPPEELSDEGPR
jgi:iron complex transport system substrate-binding protein